MPWVKLDADSATIRQIESAALEVATAGGWSQIADPPSYNSATHHAPVWSGTAWVCASKTEEEIAADNRITWKRGEFWKRFTVQEQAAIALSTNPAVAVFRVTALAAEQILSDSAETLAGLQVLKDAAIIDETRRLEILDG